MAVNTSRVPGLAAVLAVVAAVLVHADGFGDFDRIVTSFINASTSPQGQPAGDSRASNDTPTVLVGGNLIDGTNRPVRMDVDIVIERGRIRTIADSGSLALPVGATVVDVRNRWIVPGLIDSHVHYQPWMGELFLYHGVTSAFDLGNEMAILQHREAIRAGAMPGPRLFVTGQGLEGPFDGPQMNAVLRHTVRSAAEARAKASEMLDQGVDGIKIREWIPADWIRSVTEVAHARDKPVLGHLNTPAHEAVDAGMDALVHANGVDLSTLADPATLDAIRKTQAAVYQRTTQPPTHLLDPTRYAPLIAAMVRKGVFFNPTFGSHFRGVYPEGEEFDSYDSLLLDLHAPELGYLGPSIKKKLLPFFGHLRGTAVDAARRKELGLGMENVAELMRQFSRAGGKMVAGTDTSGGSGGIPGVRLHRELQLWVARGIKPIDAIRAATQYSAELFRLKDLGTVETGKRADLVILKGNPLEDIRFLGAIDKVFLDGALVRRELNPTWLRSLIKEDSPPAGVRRQE